MQTSVTVVGASGFSGVELLRLLDGLAGVRVVAVLSDRWRGEPIGRLIAGLSPAHRGLVVRPQADSVAAGADADVTLLATPAEASAELAPKLLGRRGARVLDLSGAFRLPDPDVFRAYYRFEHPEPDLLREAHYGLPQWPEAAGEAPPIERARLVSNPGCYATAAIMPLAPLVRGALVDAGALFVDGKSGITGAGRKVAETFLFTEVSENLSPYRVGNHQHAPEMELALSRVAGGRDVRITFVPHLVPLRRGLVATAFGKLADGAEPTAVEAALRDAYATSTSPFTHPVVEVTAPEEVAVQPVWGTPTIRLGVRADAARGSFVAIGALDNLMKGAASQAVENLLRMTAVTDRR